MKRNRTKHTNVVPESEQTTGNTLIMTSSDGQKVKATDVKLLPEFGTVMQRIAQAKGIDVSEDADKILDMVEVWSPDALSKPVAPNDKPKKKAVKKKAIVSEEKPKKTTTVSDEKTKKKTVKKKATTVSEEKPKKTTRKKAKVSDEKTKKKTTRKKKADT